MENKKDLERGTFFTNVPFKNAPIFPTSLPNVNVWLYPYFFLSLHIEKKALSNRRTHHIETRRDRHHYFVGCGSKDAFDDINLLQKLLQGPKN